MALYYRICIERNGKLAQSFKNEFPDGDDLISDIFIQWLAEKEICEATNVFLTKELSKQHHELSQPEIIGLNMKYLVTQTDENTMLNLSAIFKSLEDGKNNGLISEYSLSQLGLEKIFNDFAREDAETPHVDHKK